MKDVKNIAGLPLTARPPLFQFTWPTEKGHAWSTSGVYLLDHHGEPHWFATDGYSAMLTPALADIEEGSLWKPSVGGVRLYRQDHIKDLFKYVRGKYVVYDRDTGDLYSANGVMCVPPFTLGDADNPQPTEMPDISTPFQGEPEARAECGFDLRLVSAIRGGFKHTDREAGLTQTFLAGGRTLFDIEVPYRGRIVLAADGESLQPGGAGA